MAGIPKGVLIKKEDSDTSTILGSELGEKIERFDTKNESLKKQNNTPKKSNIFKSSLRRGKSKKGVTFGDDYILKGSIDKNKKTKFILKTKSKKSDGYKRKNEKNMIDENKLPDIKQKKDSQKFLASIISSLFVK